MFITVLQQKGAKTEPNYCEQTPSNAVRISSAKMRTHKMGMEASITGIASPIMHSNHAQHQALC